MKKIILSLAIGTAIVLTSCKSDTKKETEINATEVSDEIPVTYLSFGVRGNCGMCKNTIDKAANNVDGVTSANWDKDKKKIDVTFNTSKTNAMVIHQAIAASGYDTEKLAGNEEAYSNLPDCCQYDHDMAMNQSGEVKADDDSEHNH